MRPRVYPEVVLKDGMPGTCGDRPVEECMYSPGKTRVVCFYSASDIIRRCREQAKYRDYSDCSKLN